MFAQYVKVTTTPSSPIITTDLTICRSLKNRNQVLIVLISKKQVHTKIVEGTVDISSK